MDQKAFRGRGNVQKRRERLSSRRGLRVHLIGRGVLLPRGWGSKSLCERKIDLRELGGGAKFVFTGRGGGIKFIKLLNYTDSCAIIKIRQTSTPNIIKESPSISKWGWREETPLPKLINIFFNALPTSMIHNMCTNIVVFFLVGVLMPPSPLLNLDIYYKYHNKNKFWISKIPTANEKLLGKLVR